MSTLHLPRTQAASAPTAPIATSASSTALAQAMPSSALLQGKRSVEITHNGSVYRLSATRMGKLILTK